MEQSTRITEKPLLETYGSNDTFPAFVNGKVVRLPLSSLDQKIPKSTVENIFSNIYGKDI